MTTIVSIYAACANDKEIVVETTELYIGYETKEYATIANNDSGEFTLAPNMIFTISECYKNKDGG